MTHDEILVRRDGAVGHTIINRPEKRNALTGAHMHALAAALDTLDADDSVRVVALSGAGDKAFCAGADVGQFRDRTVLEQRGVYDAYACVSDAVQRLTKPLVAVVQGYALGGGCALAALCDIVVASDQAQFGTPEIRSGFFPMTVLPILMQTIGPRHALELAMTGDRIDARRAHEIGLVSRVVSHETLWQTFAELAETLASKNPTAMRLGRQAFLTMRDASYSQAMYLAREAGTVLMLTENAQEGIRAAREKRSPVWG